MRRLALVASLVWAAACAGYSSADTTANTVAARAEARQLEACAVDDAGTCSPAFVRASSSLAYCANARELTVHGAPVPEAGVSCQP